MIITGQFSDSYLPVVDGVATVIRNYAYWLKKKYGRSYVITPAFPRFKDKEDFEVLRYFSTYLPKRPPYRLGIPQIDFSFRKRISAVPFNLVHAHCPFSSGQFALHVAKRKNIPIVATFHSKYYDDFKEIVKSDHLSRYFVNKVIEFYNSVDEVWTVNKATVSTLREYGFKGNVEVVWNGTDFEQVQDSALIKKQIRQKLKVQDNERILLFVGQHVWQKNLKMLIQSLRCLKNEGTQFKMVFIGVGYALNDIKKMVDELDLENNVVFMGQINDRVELKKYYVGADLFLFPSLYDTASLVVREAAAAKCPSVLIKGSDASEGILDCKNGYLCENDASQFASKVHSILSDNESFEKTGLQARDTLYKSWEHVVDEVGQRYLEIINTYKKINASSSM